MPFGLRGSLPRGPRPSRAGSLTMAAALVVSLDATAARHLVRALEEHRRWCRANGHCLPSALSDLALLASAGQERTTSTADTESSHDAPVTPMPLLFSFAEVAEYLRTSERSVRRLAAAGELPTVEVAGKRRVHHEDLTEYAERLRHQSRPDREQIGAS